VALNLPICEKVNAELIICCSIDFIGIGSVHARTGDVLAFLFNWANAFIINPAVNAVIILTSSQYLLSGVMDGKQC
jgi:hypothetical protein